MEAIYIDYNGCDDFRIDYYEDEGVVLNLEPEVLIRVRKYYGKTYDRKHMEFFKKMGLKTVLRLRHKGLGWFEVLGVWTPEHAPHKLGERK